MKIPDNILKKIEEITVEKARREKVIADQKRKEFERGIKLDELRGSMMKELQSAATRISNWIEELMNMEDGRKLFQLVERVSIFSARFFIGEPSPPGSITTLARITLHNNGNVDYIESHKARDHVPITLGRSPLSMNTLIENLHPDFLLQLDENISKGEVWKFIEASLSK